MISASESVISTSHVLRVAHAAQATRGLFVYLLVPSFLQRCSRAARATPWYSQDRTEKREFPKRVNMQTRLKSHSTKGRHSLQGPEREGRALIKHVQLRSFVFFCSVPSLLSHPCPSRTTGSTARSSYLAGARMATQFNALHPGPYCSRHDCFRQRIKHALGHNSSSISYALLLPSFAYLVPRCLICLRSRSYELSLVPLAFVFETAERHSSPLDTYRKLPLVRALFGVVAADTVSAPLSVHPFSTCPFLFVSLPIQSRAGGAS